MLQHSVSYVVQEGAITQLTCRPCERCVKYGFKDCIDSSRKPRKTGVKRYIYLYVWYSISR